MSHPVLFVYYANDIDDPAVHRQMIDWLNKRGTPGDLSLASRLLEDLTEFPAAVEKDLNALQHGFSYGGGAFEDTTLVAFTNRAALTGEAFIANAPDWKFRSRPFQIPSARKETTALPPLSRLEVFRAALNSLSGLSEKDGAPALLVTKSHGNKTLALTTFLSNMRGHDSADAFFSSLDLQEFDGPELEGWYDLTEYANGIGVQKVEYLSALAEAGRPFKIVVMEACDSRLDETLIPSIPANVSQLMAARMALYANVDYGQVFERCRDGIPLPEALAETISPPFACQKGCLA